MSILKWLLVLTYLLWAVAAIAALINPTVKSLIPLIICSTSVIVAVVVVNRKHYGLVKFTLLTQV